MNRSSLGTLILTALSALAVLAFGAQLAREKKVVIDEESRVLRMTFAAQCLGKLDELSTLYQNHLANLCEHLEYSSDIEITSRARNIVGIEQVTIFENNQRKKVLEVKRNQKSLSAPRLLGTEPDSDGLLINPEKIPVSVFDQEANWIDSPGYPLHFAVRFNQFKSIKPGADGPLIVIRLNRQAISETMGTWLAEWADTPLEPLQSAGIKLMLRDSNSNNLIAQTHPELTGEQEFEASAAFPLRSILGTWQILAQDKMETHITYHPVLLSAAAALALLISLIGSYVYFQQKRAIRLAEQRVSFVNQVSHELRTPMTNILMNLDIATESLPPDSVAQSRMALIREETSRLSRLLENVLTFSHGNASAGNQGVSPSIKSCRVKPIIDDLIEQFQPSLSRKGLRPVTVTPTSDLQVLAEPDGLSQILSNLISNVEKYASNGDSFEIEVHQIEDTNKVLIAVSDHGPGVPPGDARRIFRPFTRLSDATSEGVSGTGLGLAIARDLAQSMGGKLQVLPRSDSSIGARFELTLPMATT